jgi:hypothetical protein
MTSLWYPQFKVPNMASYKLLCAVNFCTLRPTLNFFFVLGTESLADYDNLVREDPEDVTMEGANRILNEDDDQPEGAASVRDGTGASAGLGANTTKEPCSDRIRLENIVPFRYQTDSSVIASQELPGNLIL